MRSAFNDRPFFRPVCVYPANNPRHSEQIYKMTVDVHSDTVISDLPSKITKIDGSVVKYSYLADGRKVSSLTDDGTGLVYRGPFVYRSDASGALTFESASCEGGRLEPDAAYRYVTDHLGSTRAVARMDGYEVCDIVDYSSYGDKTQVSGVSQTRLYFTGKEDQSVDFGLPYVDFGARHYSAALHRWLVPDPLGDKTPTVSAYAYCANNPINLIDPDGRRVWPRGNSELEMIRRTLPLEDREYVVLDNHGYINHEVLSKHRSNSGNYSSLLALSSADVTVFVLENNSFTYPSNGIIKIQPMDYGGIAEELQGNDGGQGIGTIAGDSGLLGKTLLPNDSSAQRSHDNNIYVIVNSEMSDMSKAEMFAHEGYGHAYVYITTGDYDKSVHKHGPGNRDLNRYLFELINRAMNEVVHNNRQY